MKSVVERQAKRVAAAFGAREWRQVSGRSGENTLHFEGLTDECVVAWSLSLPELWLEHLSLRTFDGEQSCDFYCEGEIRCIAFEYPPFHETMARGLYCLGLEEENLLNQLNCDFSWTQKMEMRQQMPREFWPTTWYEENAVDGGEGAR